MTSQPAFRRPSLSPSASVLALALLAGLAGSPGDAAAQAAPPPPTACPSGWAPVPAGVNPALRCLPQTVVAALPSRSAAPAAPTDCPSGWRPVSPEVNPVLRCLPDRITSGRAPAGAKPTGCPAGWTRVPPGVNPLLRCLPADIAPLAKPQRVAPTGCPTGWKPVEPGVNPMMRCLPGSVISAGTEPLQGGPGTGDPGQGRDAQLKLATSDLVLLDPFRIGTTAMAWGTSGSVPASAAAFRRNGACGFRYLYRTRNDGGAASGATANRLRRDTQAGPVLATDALPALAAGATANADGHVVLKPGTWVLYAHADAPGAVAESNETNNLRRVRVTVTGSCGG